jgi:hypothetical protein
VAILVGAALVFFLFPRQRQEEELLRRYHAEDTAKVSGPGNGSESAFGRRLTDSDRPTGRSVSDGRRGVPRDA